MLNVVLQVNLNYIWQKSVCLSSLFRLIVFSPVTSVRLEAKSIITGVALYFVLRGIEYQ